MVRYTTKQAILDGKLIRLAKDHNITVHFECNTIYLLQVYGQIQRDRNKPIKWFQDWVVCPATVRELYDWLGY